MIHQMRILQGLKLVAVLAVALSMGACANKSPFGADGAMASAATPGSQQAFGGNVGERDPGKAGAMAAELQSILIYHRRACRRTWHPRIQYRARCPPRPVGSHLPGLARHRPQPHADDLLRQGAPGRGV